MANLKPILVIATMFLAVVMLWQVATITGFLTNETIPANVTIENIYPYIPTQFECGNSNVITPSPCQNITVDCWIVAGDLNGADDLKSVEAELVPGEVVGATKSGCNFGQTTPGNCYYANCTSFTIVNSTERNYTCTFNDFRYWSDIKHNEAQNINNWTVEWAVKDGVATRSPALHNISLINITAIDVIETYLGFGSMALGATTTNDTEINSTAQNCGNGNFTVNASGTDLPCNTQGTISVGQLHYNSTFGTDYTNDTALTTSSTDTSLTAYVATSDVPTVGVDQNLLSWQISIPTTGVKGLCTGNVTFYAIRY